MAESSRPVRRKRIARKATQGTSFNTPESLGHGLTFSNEEQLVKFMTIQSWKMAPTRFACQRALHVHHILEPVTQLFAHIGWASVLSWHEFTYETPTLEFLSTAFITSDGQSLRFRTQNQDCAIPMDSINELGSSNDRNYTYGPDELDIGDFDQYLFWEQISDDPDTYDPRTAKASLIRHPALKIAHRLLVHLFFSRDDAGTISSYELHLLYAMTHGDPHDPTRPKPDFAKWLLHKPLLTAQGHKRRIRCGGIITHILKCEFVPPHLRFTDEGQRPVPGDTRFDGPAIVRTKMYIVQPSAAAPTHYVWLRCIDNSPYLRVPIQHNAPDSTILHLTPDVRNQNWMLPDNTIGPRPDRYRTTPRQPLPRYPDPDQYQAPPPEYPPYHHQYMGAFDYLRDRVDTIETTVSGLRADFTTEREQARLHREAELAFHADARARMQAQQTYEEEMLRLNRRLHDYHFPPPPPGPF